MHNPFYLRYIPPFANNDPQSPVEARVAKLEISPKHETAASETPSRKPKKRRKLTVQESRPNVERDEERHKAVLAKFEKSVKTSNLSAKDEEQSEVESEEGPDLAEDEIKDLVPIPQPKISPPREFKPLFSATPGWIANPVKAYAERTASFTSLGVEEAFSQQLQRKGYEQAFAVQTAVLPLLLQGPACHRGDVCISAATGSGKTLAYMIPIVQALKKRPFPRLSAIIVAPTRDLVRQIREVANQCVARTSLKIGIAIGSQTFAAEQELLIEKGRRYDPQGYEKLQARANETYLCGEEGIDQYLKDAVDTLVYHVPHYESKVDILICTPGRLAEHLRSTVGFNLDEVEWFVIDEVDSMMDREFHLWANTVIKQLYEEKPVERMNARDRLLMTLSGTTKEKLIRKIVLSATMTTDIAKLQLLQLKRPKLVLLENSRPTEQDKPAEAPGQERIDLGDQPAEIDLGSAIVGDKYELPSTLYEWAVPVDDDAYKPLYILWLLQKRILGSKSIDQPTGLPNETTHEDSSDLEEGEEQMSSASSGSDSSDDTHSSKASEDRRSLNQKRSQSQPQSQSRNQSSILIFTKSNESAARLAHLLSHLLEPPHSKSIFLLDKAPKSKKNRLSSRTSTYNTNFTLSALRRLGENNKRQDQNTPAILIASDRASRGLDLRSIRHVINYDVPRNVRSYVHRAGRTARAGEAGECWTLYGFKEAAWFWREIGRNDSGSIGRRVQGGKVEKVKVDAGDVLGDEWKDRYEVALEELRKGVMGEEKHG